ncbi:unnamed protein product [Soboliphyme baturini]|uniref:Uncharacterized protein n=1 Tax=Soboliphyme baturini TaxID=241478 RepID=A0A183IJ51_9BILA|nr:unnamed protein product [Soboliphyme baturini]
MLTASLRYTSLKTINLLWKPKIMRHDEEVPVRKKKEYWEEAGSTDCRSATYLRRACQSVGVAVGHDREDQMSPDSARSQRRQTKRAGTGAPADGLSYESQLSTTQNVWDLRRQPIILELTPLPRQPCANATCEGGQLWWQVELEANYSSNKRLRNLRQDGSSKHTLETDTCRSTGSTVLPGRTGLPFGKVVKPAEDLQKTDSLGLDLSIVADAVASDDSVGGSSGGGGGGDGSGGIDSASSGCRTNDDDDDEDEQQ